MKQAKQPVSYGNDDDAEDDDDYNDDVHNASLAFEGGEDNYDDDEDNYDDARGGARKELLDLLLQHRLVGRVTALEVALDLGDLRLAVTRPRQIIRDVGVGAQQ